MSVIILRSGTVHIRFRPGLPRQLRHMKVWRLSYAYWRLSLDLCTKNIFKMIVLPIYMYIAAYNRFPPVY